MKKKEICVADVVLDAASYINPNQTCESQWTCLEASSDSARQLCSGAPVYSDGWESYIPMKSRVLHSGFLQNRVWAPNPYPRPWQLNLYDGLTLVSRFRRDYWDANAVVTFPFTLVTPGQNSASTSNRMAWTYSNTPADKPFRLWAEVR